MLSATLLGTPWIEDTAFQEFSINLITELKAPWEEILLNSTYNCNLAVLSRREGDKERKTAGEWHGAGRVH